MNILHALDDPKVFAPFFSGDSWDSMARVSRCVVRTADDARADRDLSAAHWPQRATVAARTKLGWCVGDAPARRSSSLSSRSSSPAS